MAHIILYVLVPTCDTLQIALGVTKKKIYVYLWTADFEDQR